MLTQFAMRPKSGRTLIAEIRFITEMRSLMLVQIVALGKGASAERTFVGFIAGMNARVALQMVGRVESDCI